MFEAIIYREKEFKDFLKEGFKDFFNRNSNFFLKKRSARKKKVSELFSIKINFVSGIINCPARSEIQTKNPS